MFRSVILTKTLAARCAGRRCFRTLSSATGSGSSNGYTSPFQEFFDMMEEGRTSLGTTSETPSPEERLLKCGIKEDALRFKTQCYGRLQLPPYVQPGEHRVTLKVGMESIPMETEMEWAIFRQIVGGRISEKTNELCMSSEQFGSRIENKRHLVSMLDRIVLSTKRLAKELPQEAKELQQEEEEQP